MLSVTIKGKNILIPYNEVISIREIDGGASIQVVNAPQAWVDVPESFASLLASDGCFVEATSGPINYAVNPANVFRVYGPVVTISFRHGAPPITVDEPYSTIAARFQACASSGGGGGSVLAENVVVAPSGNLSSTDAQAALEELQGDIDLLDGSETQVSAGSNVTITGTGTILDPYVVNASVGFLNDLSDVNASGAVDGQSLVYSGGVWSPAAPAPFVADQQTIVGQATVLEPIKLGPQGADTNRHLLWWDVVENDWVAKELSLSGLDFSATTTDVEIGLRYRTQKVLDSLAIVVASYFGSPPTVVANGSNEEEIVVTIPDDCILKGIVVFGGTGETDNGTKYVRFEGPGLPGNTSVTTMYPPTIQKINGITSIAGGPSRTVPFSVDIDNNPSAKITGIGSAGAPMVEVMFQGLSPELHILKLTF